MLLPRALSAHVLLAVLGVGILRPGTAHAQPSKTSQPATAQDITHAEARARFNEGLALADAGNHEAARLKFNQAWALLKNAAILYNLARAEQLSGHPVDAIEHYRLFSRMPADPRITDVQRQRAAENITELAKEIGQIAVDAPPGSRVSIDGRSVDPDTTDPVPVTPGKHLVEAIADGKIKAVSVDCPAGAITKASLVDRAPPAPPPPPTSPEPTTRNAEASPAFWTTGRIAGAGIAAAGLIAAGVGVGFHVAAGSSADRIDGIKRSFPSGDYWCNADNYSSNRARCDELFDVTGDQHTRQDLGSGFLVAGGVLLVGGAALFLVSGERSSDRVKGLTIAPVLSARQTGLSFAGRF